MYYQFQPALGPLKQSVKLSAQSAHLALMAFWYSPQPPWSRIWKYPAAGLADVHWGERDHWGICTGRRLQPPYRTPLVHHYPMSLPSLPPVTSHQVPPAAESQLLVSGWSAGGGGGLTPVKVLTAPPLESLPRALMDLPNLCLTQKSPPDAKSPMHCPAPNISPLVLPQAKVPKIFGDYMLFLKGANLMPQAFLFRKLQPESPTSFPFPPGSILDVVSVARVTSPIPSLHQRQLLLREYFMYFPPLSRSSCSERGPL